MNKKDKFFFLFVAIWFAAHGVGMLVLGHAYAGVPSETINLLFVGLLATIAFWWK